MRLAPNEEIIKEWHYANGKTKDGTLACSLIITNKRVISARHSSLTNTRDEIRADDVCAVHAVSLTQSIVKAIVLFLIGALALAGGAILCSQAFTRGPSYMLTIGGTILGVGIVCLIVSLYLLLHVGCKMEVVICSKTLANPGISISQNGMKPGAAPSNKVIKVKVDKAIAKEVVEELGAILLGK